jgi:hypothetical protein
MSVCAVLVSVDVMSVGVVVTTVVVTDGHIEVLVLEETVVSSVNPLVA